MLHYAITTINKSKSRMIYKIQQNSNKNKTLRFSPKFMQFLSSVEWLRGISFTLGFASFFLKGRLLHFHFRVHWLTSYFDEFKQDLLWVQWCAGSYPYYISSSRYKNPNNNHIPVISFSSPKSSQAKTPKTLYKKKTIGYSPFEGRASPMMNV